MWGRRIFSCCLIGFCGWAAAQTPLPVPNLTFDRGGTLFAVARDAQGRMLIGGLFSSVGGQPRSNLARLLADGSVDPTFLCNASSAVRAIAVSATGLIYVGGDFTTINGVSKPRLAQVGDICVVNPAFPAQAPNGSVRALALVASDTKVFAGGSFSTPRSRIARIDAVTGSYDAELAVTVSGLVRALVPDGQGGVLIGGSFTSVNSLAGTQNLAHLTYDAMNATFLVRSGFPVAGVDAANPNGSVNALALDAGQLFVGGAFTQMGNAAIPRLAKLSVDTGQVDGTYVPAPIGGVNSLLVQGNALYAAATFGSQPNLGPRARLARLDTSNASMTWSSFSDRDINALATGAAGILAAGNFVVAGTDVRPALAEFDVTAGQVMALNAEVLAPGGANCHLKLADGRLWVGGNFLRVNGAARAGLALINTDGSVDAGQGAATYGNLGVWTLVPDAAGRVYVGGGFSLVQGMRRDSLFRLDTSGAVDASFPIEAPPGSGGVFDLFLDGSRLFVAGSFDSIGAVGQPKVVQANAARINLSTNVVDSGWNPLIVPGGTGFPVQTAALDPANDRLYLGGAIASVDGTAVNLVAAIHTESGELIPSFAPTPASVSSSADVWALALDPGPGRLYIGGIGIETVSGQSGFGQLFRVSTSDGVLDAGWNPGTGADDAVEFIAIEGDDVYGCGYVTHASVPGGDGLLRFSRATGDLDGSFLPNMSACANVSTDPVRRQVTASGGNVLQAGNEREGVATFYSGIFSDGFEQ